MRQRKGLLRTIGWGLFGAGIGFCGLAVFVLYQLLQEARIGRALVATGQPVQALVVTAQRVANSDCDHSQRRLCRDADNLIGTVVYQVSGLRFGSDINLTPEEYHAYSAGDEVFADLIYLPSNPAHVERTSGQRVSAARRDGWLMYPFAGIGLTFACIGGIAVAIARKQTRARAAPSTGPDS